MVDGKVVKVVPKNIITFFLAMEGTKLPQVKINNVDHGKKPLIMDSFALIDLEIGGIMERLVVKSIVTPFLQGKFTYGRKVSMDLCIFNHLNSNEDMNKARSMEAHKML